MSNATLLWIVAGWWLALGLWAAFVFGSAARQQPSCGDALPRWPNRPRITRVCAYRTHHFNVLPALVVTHAATTTYDLEAGKYDPYEVRGLVGVQQRTLTLALKWLRGHVGVCIAYGPTREVKVWR